MDLTNLGRKIGVGALVGTMAFSLVACDQKEKKNDATPKNAATQAKDNKAKDGDKAKKVESMQINVVSREEGSGTRSAFTEITKVMAKNDKGEEKDNTSPEAVVQNSTDAVMQAVGNDKAAVGYISLGSLNDTVKAVKIEGVEANGENIKNKSYKIARPFNIVYKEGLAPEVQDFLNFIESDEAQKIAEEQGYVPNMQGKKYQAKGNKAQITIAGSTSVAPLMEKFVEAYTKLNPEFKADIQATGSSAGVKSALDGSAQIGMASRELKDSEKSLKTLVCAMDGIAVIVNKESAIEDLTMEQVKTIFEGKLTDWAEVNAK